MVVAVSRVPMVGGHHAVLEVPFDEQHCRDAQHEHGRLFRVPGPPDAAGGGAQLRACRGRIRYPPVGPCRYLADVLLKNYLSSAARGAWSNPAAQGDTRVASATGLHMTGRRLGW